MRLLSPLPGPDAPPARPSARTRRTTAVVVALLVGAAPAVLPGALAPAAAAAGTTSSTAGSTSVGTAVDAAAATATAAVSLEASHTAVRKGERMWFTGRATISGGPAASRTIAIERKGEAGTWSRYATVRTTATGRFTVSVRPAGNHTYRAALLRKAKATTAAARATGTSGVVAVGLDRGARTIESRAAVLGERLGAPTREAKRLSGAKVTATRRTAAQAVRWQRFDGGMLVEVQTGSLRAWYVSGKILRAYEAAGGPTGTLGVPLHDARCGLPDKGCVQRFSRGVLYSSSVRAKAVRSNVTGRRGEVIATARAQVGLQWRLRTETSHTTKFNTWMGSPMPWCSMFQSWVSYASGNGGLFPKRATYAAFEKTVRTTMKTGRTPRVGALAIISSRPPWSRPTHVALVVAVDGARIKVIDGNTVGGPIKPGHRGIKERWLNASFPLYYAYPKY